MNDRDFLKRRFGHLLHRWAAGAILLVLAWLIVGAIRLANWLLK